jgi:hypothetical protein
VIFSLLWALFYLFGEVGIYVELDRVFISDLLDEAG